jgi:hypothetical protein
MNIVKKMEVNNKERRARFFLLIIKLVERKDGDINESLIINTMATIDTRKAKSLKAIGGNISKKIPLNTIPTRLKF